MLKNYSKLSLIVALAASVIINQPQANAQENPFDPDYQSQEQDANNLFNAGVGYFNNYEYSKAIDSFLKALKFSPDDVAIRSNTAAAFTARGNYFFDKAKDYNKAADDYRLALYYFAFYKSDNANQDSSNIKIATDNLLNALNASKIDLSPKNRFKIAKGLKGQGSFRQAVIEFNEALKEPSLKYESYVYLGDIMRVLQKDFQAAEYYDKALIEDDSNSELHAKFAKVLSAMGNQDAAIKEFNIALEGNFNKEEILPSLEILWRTRVQENPNDAVAHMNLGVIMQKKGAYDEALNEYIIAQNIDPVNPTIRLDVGTLYQAKGNLVMALQAYDSIIQAYPENSLAHYYKATALKESNLPVEAIKEYQLALGLDKNNKKIQKELFEMVNSLPAEQALQASGEIASANTDNAFYQYLYAFILHKNNKSQDALEFYKKAYTIDSKNIDAYLNAAVILQEKSQFNEAEELLNKVLAINPRNQKAKELLEDLNDDILTSKYQKAADLLKKGDYKGAIVEYNKITTPDKEVYWGLGASYQGLSDYANAIVSYKKAVALDENDAMSLYYLGSAYFDKKDYLNAEAYFRKALKLEPDNVDIKEAIKDLDLARVDYILDLGVKQYNSGKYQDALASFNRVIKVTPKNGYAYYYRGMAYDGLKKYYNAVNDYKMALKYTADLNAAYYALAVDYDMLKNYPQAKIYYKKFVDVSGKNVDVYVKDAKSRLKQL